jgi:hypothetical protein
MEDHNIVCRICDGEHIVTFSREDFVKWLAGAFIQDAFPYLTADERELIQSTMCGKCFDKIFPEMEEED